MLHNINNNDETWGGGNPAPDPKELGSNASKKTNKKEDWGGATGK